MSLKGTVPQVSSASSLISAGSGEAEEAQRSTTQTWEGMRGNVCLTGLNHLPLSAKTAAQ